MSFTETAPDAAQSRTGADDSPSHPAAPVGPFPSQVLRLLARISVGEFSATGLEKAFGKDFRKRFRESVVVTAPNERGRGKTEGSRGRPEELRPLEEPSVMKGVTSMMRKTKVSKPYGSWPSKLTSEVVTAGALRLGGMQFGVGGRPLWLEGRPQEGGRNVLVADGTDLTPKDMNVRTRVHEYGGGAWKVLPDLGLALFTDFKTQFLYKQSLATTDLTPLTPEVENAELRFADFELDATRNRVICVMEDHRGDGKEPVNSLAAVDLDGGRAEPVTIAAGSDFYASPVLSRDGTKLAYVSWEHPAMPWDITSIFVVELGEDGLPSSEPKLVAGGPGKEEAPQQPQFCPNGRLIYISDEGTGWWNLFELEAEGRGRSICPMPGCEFGGPPWMLGTRTYEVLNDDKILCSYSSADKPTKTLAYLKISTGALEEVPIPYGVRHTAKLEGKEKGLADTSPLFGQ